MLLIYSAAVNQFAPLGDDASITNTVSCGMCQTFTAQETITMADGHQLTITKAINPSTVVENGRLTHTFTIRNNDNKAAVATDNVTLTDLFDPVLMDLAVTFNGVNWTMPTNYTYNEATGLFATVPGQITVPAATYAQDPVTGVWSITPGISVLTVVGTV